LQRLLNGEKVKNLLFMIVVVGGVGKSGSAEQENGGQQEITAFSGHGEHPCAMGSSERMGRMFIGMPGKESREAQAPPRSHHPGGTEAANAGTLNFHAEKNKTRLRSAT
jgi:hypothetical protein